MTNFDSSHCSTHEEYLAFLREKHIAFLNQGVANEWWESFNERGEPVPFPTKLSIADFPNIMQVVVEVGVMPSITQARKNGFDRPSTLGLHTFKKGQVRVLITE